MDDDFSELQTETEAQRIALEKLYDSSHAYLKAISKRVEGEDKYKGLAIETFGISMSAQSYTLPEGSAYREALHQMGDAHQNIGAAQGELLTTILFLDTNVSYSRPDVDDSLNRPTQQALEKKLHSKRLDYDAKLAKVQKAKKEKPEWEEEMQAAKAKYEDTRESVLGIMFAIRESQDEDMISLKAYYDAQLTFARRMVEILEAIPESAFVAIPSASKSRNERRIYRQISFDHDEERTSSSDDHSNTCSLPPGNHHLDRAPSLSDIRRYNTFPNNRSSTDTGLNRSSSQLIPNGTPIRKNSAEVNRTSVYTPSMPSPPAPAPPLPVREKSVMQARALYNFDATAEGELSLRKGDVVKIIEKIDEGWWEGEFIDENGDRYEGMFPSNYVEEIEQDNELPTQPLCPSSMSSTPDSTQYADADEQAYYGRETVAAELSPRYEEPEPHYPQPEPQPIQIPMARRAPPPPMTRQHSFTARATPPPSRPASGMATSNKTVGSRMAPPPPSTRRVRL
ncbi:hypothetical protein FBU30_001589 [Linnemannia zychae]|nr:hypothetical protein FBU30_001589 [Linnemannia zychae]